MSSKRLGVLFAINLLLACKKDRPASPITKESIPVNLSLSEAKAWIYQQTGKAEDTLNWSHPSSLSTDSATSWQVQLPGTPKKAGVKGL